MTRPAALAPLTALALAGCGPSGDETAAGTASVSEKRALEDAAEMIPPAEESEPGQDAVDGQ